MTDQSQKAGAGPDLGVVYRESRERLSDLLRNTDAKAVPVPACPRWSAHDVVSHLVAIIEDAMASRLTGPPTDEHTAEQVSRRCDRETDGLLDEWADLAPAFEAVLAEMPIWPAALDVLSHEQDVRGALGKPGARDIEGITAGAAWLVENLTVPVRLMVHLDDRAIRRGPDEDGQKDQSPADLELRTTAFETLRWRLGRRSRMQLEALDWRGDPTPVLDQLAVFGPTPVDIIE